MRLSMSCTMLLLTSALLGCHPASKEVSQQPLGGVESQSLNTISQADIDTLAGSLDVKYRLVTNIPTDKCNQDVSDGACFEVELSFTAAKDITATDWSIYFSQISPIQSSESQWFDVRHINGDMHQITLKDSFNGFVAGETKTLLFRANFWSLSETDALPNYIITSDGLTAKVIESTKVKYDLETGLEILPYVVPYTDVAKHFKRGASDKTKWLSPEALYERNQSVADQNIEITHQIIPTPASLKVVEQGHLDISKGLTIQWNNVDEQDVSSAVDRLEKLGFIHRENGISLNLSIKENNKQKIGSYQLEVTHSAINIEGVDANGVFNGLQSLAGLKALESHTLPFVKVIDEPHYEFRGLLVDVARNFHSKAFILKLLDQMAAYKLNKLHLHLGDDEGWRIEIPSLPELTEVGSKRCFDPTETQCLMPQLGAGVDETSSVNGFYSVADYQEILRAASARFIQVIPSLDMPGHSRAAVKAMTARYQKYMAKEQEDKALEFLLHDIDDQTQYSSVQYYNDNTINVCLESSYAFVEQVMHDVKMIHEQAGHPLTRYHIGADETAGAWVESPKCKDFLAKHKAEIASAKDLGAYFVERTANILADLGIEAAAWIDGLEHTNPDNMPAVIQANAWHPLAFGGHKSSHKLANYNWQVVVSSPDVLYFDFPYEADPKEHGYYWAARQINSEKIFQFMPDNLPIHAEFWLDREDKPYTADDRLTKSEDGKIISGPLKEGITFYGVQGQLWSENTRNDATAEYKIYPRLFALAERAWHQADWSVPYNYQGFEYSQSTKVFNNSLKAKRDKAWQQFAYTIGQKELPKLDLDKVNYRLPTVGAKVLAGKLYANIAYPGLTIEYKDSDSSWKTYAQPVDVTGAVSVRSRTSDGSRSGRISVLRN